MGVYVIMSGVEHTRKPFKYQALMGEIPCRAGVYVLFCDEEVIYIGNGLDVRQRLLSNTAAMTPVSSWRRITGLSTTGTIRPGGNSCYVRTRTNMATCRVATSRINFRDNPLTRSSIV